MSCKHLKTFRVAKLLTAVLVSAATSLAYAGDELGFDEDEGPNSEFYSQALSEKLRANNQIAKALSGKIRAMIAAAHKTHAPKKLALYGDFKNRLTEAVLNSRKIADGKCQRRALKFQKLNARASDVANCRTEVEVKIEHDLQKLEIELKHIAQ